MFSLYVTQLPKPPSKVLPECTGKEADQGGEQGEREFESFPLK